MNNYIPIDCKHCMYHYDDEFERSIGKEWCNYSFEGALCIKADKPKDYRKGQREINICWSGDTIKAAERHGG